MDEIEHQDTWRCKLGLIGNSGAGKTSILQRYIENRFSSSFIATIGVDMRTKNVQVGNCLVRAAIWDTAGQERFRSMTKGFYRGAKGIAIVYDVTDRKSFENVNVWMRHVKRWSGEDTICILLGNKCDEKQLRAITNKQGEDMAKEHNMQFMETSALDGTNVDEAFQRLLEQVVESNEDNIRRYNENNNKNDDFEDVDVLDGQKIHTTSAPVDKKRCCSSVG